MFCKHDTLMDIKPDELSFLPHKYFSDCSDLSLPKIHHDSKTRFVIIGVSGSYLMIMLCSSLDNNK